MGKKTLVICFLAFLVSIYMSLSSTLAFGNKQENSVKTISIGMNLPQVALDLQGSSDKKKYLGLEDFESFSFSQISAKIIVLEIFSFYCPHCRNQAPVLNKIYNFIQQDPALTKGIKMIGVAAGTDQSKVDVWKTTLHVPFPLFPDPETTIWQKFGKPGVPCTLIATKSGKVLAVHYGASEDPEKLFRQIKNFYEEQN